MPHGPGRVSGPKAQHFFCHLFEPGLSVCLWSLAHQTMTWLHRKLQDLSSNQRTSVHGPWPVRWCTAQVQNSSNTFSCHHTKYTAFCIQPNCGTQCRSTNVCSSSCRGHTTSRSLLCTCRPWTGLRRVCQPNLPLSHIPLQYIVNFICSATLVFFLLCFSTSS